MARIQAGDTTRCSMKPNVRLRTVVIDWPAKIMDAAWIGYIAYAFGVRLFGSHREGSTNVHRRSWYNREELGQGGTYPYTPDDGL